MYMSLPKYMSIHCMHELPVEARRRALDPLKTELQTVVSCVMGAGN